MENDIIQYLRKNIKFDNLKNRLFPIFTTDIKEASIAYNFTPVKGGTLKETQLNLTIACSDYDKAKEIEKEINKIMDMNEGDTFKLSNKTYFKSYTAGGGILFNDVFGVYEDNLFFIIRYRNTAIKF